MLAHNSILHSWTKHMEINLFKKGISVTQRKYVLDLLKETGMLRCKLVDKLMDFTNKIGNQKDSTPVHT